MNFLGSKFYGYVPRCEPFSTYPRSYDLIHVASIESLIRDPASGKNRYFIFNF